jgi:hypothetical protein
MKTNEEPPKPKVYKEQDIDFWYALQQEELRAIEELEESIMLHDPIAKAKALGRLKRVMMDYFVEKYIDFLGNHRGYPCYRIDYSYHKDWQNGCDFSIYSEIKKLKNV